MVWSDQGKLKLQIAGLAARNDDETCLIDTQENAWSFATTVTMSTIEAVNAAKEFMAARRLFEQGSISRKRYCRQVRCSICFSHPDLEVHQAFAWSRHTQGLPGCSARRIRAPARGQP